MRLTTIKRACCSPRRVLAATTLLALAISCGGSSESAKDSPQPGAAGAAGAAAGEGGAQASQTDATTAGDGGADSHSSEECAVDLDCTPLLPPTSPAHCAEASCDPTTFTCLFSAKDADKDGHPALDCASEDPNKPVAIGDDCDDGDADVYPGAWDGPADGKHPDHCGDGIDQNCSGADGDDTSSKGATCECKVGDTATCSEDAGGIPVAWPLGKPAGACRYGVKTCAKDAQTGKIGWGACIGAIGPRPEYCNGGIDDNCRDNGDDDAVDKVNWVFDGDNDLHGHQGWSPRLDCGDAQPSWAPKECIAAADPGDVDAEAKCVSERWRVNIPADDCDDSQSNVFPGATEICDQVDNDCNGAVDDAARSVDWYFDGDADGHVLASAVAKNQCENPGLKPANCPTDEACTKLWTSNPTTHLDCDDANADRHPGNWDGPLALRVGMIDPGWKREHFARTAGTATMPPGPSEVAASTSSVPRIDMDWGLAGGDYWAERYSGTFSIAVKGDYVFYATADDGVRLWLDDAATPVIDGWSSGGGTTRKATATLAAGNHSIRLEYYDNTGKALLKLEWQGPDGSGIDRQVMREAEDASTGAQPERCDGVDQDCNGTVDDAVATSNGSARACNAACQPGQVGQCGGLNASAVANVGACRNGIRTCSVNGSYSACSGSVEVSSEVCDGADNNCNSSTDEGLLQTFYFDKDNDGYGDKNTASVQACSAPASGWKTSIPNTDCDDNDSAKNPGKAEVCDGKDNDCNSNVDDGIAAQGNCDNQKLGACKRYGQVVCTNGSFQCNAANAFGGGAQSTPFVDAQGISTFDWDCDGHETPEYSALTDACGRYTGYEQFCNLRGDCRPGATSSAILCPDTACLGTIDTFNNCNDLKCGGSYTFVGCSQNGSTCSYNGTKSTGYVRCH